jgi:nitroreductase
VDFEFRSSYAALGAAAENLCLAAHDQKLEVILQPFPSERNPKHVAAFEFRDSPCADAEAHICDDLSAQIPHRHTNRRPGKRQPVSRIILDALSAVVQTVPGAELQWLDEPQQLEEAGRLIGICDRLRMLDPQHHREMFQEIRWTPDEVASTRDGVDIDTLYLSATDRAGMVICSEWSALELIREWDLGKKLESISGKLVRNASAMGLLTMPDSRPLDFFNGGRAMQRMWLAATQCGLAVHPMATLPYFFAAAAAHDSSIDSRMAAVLQELREPYERLFRRRPANAEILLFRISFASPADKRSLRRPVEDVLN